MVGFPEEIPADHPAKTLLKWYLLLQAADYTLHTLSICPSTMLVDVHGLLVLFFIDCNRGHIDGLVAIGSTHDLLHPNRLQRSIFIEGVLVEQVFIVRRLLEHNLLRIVLQRFQILLFPTHFIFKLFSKLADCLIYLSVFWICADVPSDSVDHLLEFGDGGRVGVGP